MNTLQLRQANPLWLQHGRMAMIGGSRVQTLLGNTTRVKWCIQLMNSQVFYTSRIYNKFGSSWVLNKSLSDNINDNINVSKVKSVSLKTFKTPSIIDYKHSGFAIYKEHFVIVHIKCYEFLSKFQKDLRKVPW